jgi:Flp pilus assembly CpaF family ATPase
MKKNEKNVNSLNGETEPLLTRNQVTELLIYYNQSYCQKGTVKAVQTQIKFRSSRNLNN